MVYMYISLSFLLIFLVKTSVQVSCLTNVRDYEIQLNDTNPKGTIQNLTSDLINRTQQESFCSFNLSLFHTKRLVKVQFSRLNGVKIGQIVVQTAIEIVKHATLMTVMRGVCTRHACDLEYTISAVQWMLTEGKSYGSVEKELEVLLEKGKVTPSSTCLQWMNTHRLQDCVGLRCLSRNFPNVYLTGCMNTTRAPFAELEVFAQINQRNVTTQHKLIFLCKLSYCNIKRTETLVFYFMWKRFKMDKLFKTKKLTNFPDDETTIKPTTISQRTQAISSEKLRCDSRSGTHHMYRKYRDLTRALAIIQCYRNMGGKYHARLSNIQIMEGMNPWKTYRSNSQGL
ncbi:unnamed protein product [Adineta ricciae]|uniref:Large ribosomal subunit protein eL20 n=1 Tax=Adineta ricciae TaxID=249248 RepID=A0A815QHB9_ADIRI|nr:unnamed protein product [Adineta ricciae]CAF1464004.1 unnamed protein product [Adineta ricciae]